VFAKFLDFIWTEILNFLDYGWTWTEFKNQDWIWNATYDSPLISAPRAQKKLVRAVLGRKLED